MGVIFQKHKNRYYVKKGKKCFSYSINRHGKYAKLLAEQSFNNGIKYFDYCKDNNDGTSTFYVPTKAYGLKTVLVDTEDVPLLNKSKVSIYYDGHSKTFYASNKEMRLHRIVMKMTKGDGLLVDHINHNGLDNRKSNLRIVTVSQNNRNCMPRQNNEFGVNGVFRNGNSIRATWRDNNYNRCSKSFSVLKYGEKLAIEMAIEARKKAEMLYGYYDTSVKRSETIEKRSNTNLVE